MAAVLAVRSAPSGKMQLGHYTFSEIRKNPNSGHHRTPTYLEDMFRYSEAERFELLVPCEC